LSEELLVQKGLDSRPDLLAMRLGIDRARSDLKLAQANRYPDAYLLYQPYTFQNNTYLGVQSPTSWTLGITTSMPLFNRNQGNITRARINVRQTEIQVQDYERSVVNDVLNAIREFEASRAVVLSMNRDVVPPARKVRNTAFRLFLEGQTSILEYFAAQRDYNDTVRSLRDALIRHRRAMLDLNTAVGERVLP